MKITEYEDFSTRELAALLSADPVGADDLPAVLGLVCRRVAELQAEVWHLEDRLDAIGRGDPDPDTEMT